MHTFVSNLYQPHARLFVHGGAEISSSEGTTQGGPESKAIYALAKIPLLSKLKAEQPEEYPAKYVAYADDAVGAGRVQNLRIWWNALQKHGPEFGYFINASKSWLIIKPHLQEEATQAFDGTGVNITMEGQRHLGAAIGSNKFKESFVANLVQEWVKEIIMLSRIAKIDPHCAYAAYTHGLRHKYTYTMRTIPDIAELLQPVENAIRNHLLPSLTENFSCNDTERKLLSLPVKFGGLGIPNPTEDALHEFQKYVKLTETLTKGIIAQSSSVEKK